MCHTFLTFSTNHIFVVLLLNQINYCSAQIILDFFNSYFHFYDEKHFVLFEIVFDIILNIAHNKPKENLSILHKLA